MEYWSFHYGWDTYTTKCFIIARTGWAEKLQIIMLIKIMMIIVLKVTFIIVDSMEMLWYTTVDSSFPVKDTPKGK